MICGVVGRYIPEMAMGRIQNLLKEVKRASERLGTLPSNVEEFVHFTTYLNQLAGDTIAREAAAAADPDSPAEEAPVEDAVVSFKAMEGRQLDVGDLMELVKEFNIKTTSKQRTSFMELSQALSSLKSQVEFSRGSTEANGHRFVKVGVIRDWCGMVESLLGIGSRNSGYAGKRYKGI